MSHGASKVVDAAAARAGVSTGCIYNRMARYGITTDEAAAMGGPVPHTHRQSAHRRAWDHQRKSHERMETLVGQRVALNLTGGQRHGVVVAVPRPAELDRKMGPKGPIVVWHRTVTVLVDGERHPRPVAYERVRRMRTEATS